MGIESENYPDRLEHANIAIQIINKVSRIPFSMVHTHVDAWKEFALYLKTGSMHIKPDKFRARVKVELLREPKYRIYFNHDDIQDTLKLRLQSHESVFTPYLGTSSMIANFNYIGEYQFSTTYPKEPVYVHSLIPFSDRFPQIHLEDGITYAIEQNIPIHLRADRSTTGTFSALYSPNGANIKVSDVETQALETERGKEHVIFLPTQVSS